MFFYRCKIFIQGRRVINCNVTNIASYCLLFSEKYINGMKTTFQELINQDIPVLVDFYADWCGPCKMQTPILENVSRQITGKAKIIKVDVDKNQSAADKYQVRSIPTLILFKKGQIMWRQAGVANENQLLEIIKSQY